MLEIANKISFGYESLDEAFPACDPGVNPFGSRVLVQVRTPKQKTSGGIILTRDVQETEAWNTQVGKILAVGPLAFRDRKTMEQWPEGVWCEIGDFVRVPRYGGDKWTVPAANGDDAVVVIFNDLDLVGKIVGDPLAVKAFL
jgi:co-chaperonin GroES (HSP10)